MGRTVEAFEEHLKNIYKEEYKPSMDGWKKVADILKTLNIGLKQDNDKAVIDNDTIYYIDCDNNVFYDLADYQYIFELGVENSQSYEDADWFIREHEDTPPRFIWGHEIKNRIDNGKELELQYVV